MRKREKLMRTAGERTGKILGLRVKAPPVLSVSPVIVISSEKKRFVSNLWIPLIPTIEAACAGMLAISP